MNPSDAEKLEQWQQLYQSWRTAFQAAVEAESALHLEISKANHNNALPPQAGAAHIEYTARMDRLMQLWLIAAQSLTSVDEFVHANSAFAEQNGTAKNLAQSTVRQAQSDIPASSKMDAEAASKEKADSHSELVDLNKVDHGGNQQHFLIGLAN